MDPAPSAGRYRLLLLVVAGSLAHKNVGKVAEVMVRRRANAPPRVPTGKKGDHADGVCVHVENTKWQHGKPGGEWGSGLEADAARLTELVMPLNEIASKCAAFAGCSRNWSAVRAEQRQVEPVLRLTYI